MSLSATALSEVATYTTNIYPPDAGTPILAADVEAGEQALANRTKYLASLPRIVQVVTSSQADATQAHPAITTSVPIGPTGGLFVNSGTKITLTGLATNDIVHLQAFLFVEMSAPGTAYVRFGNTLTSIALDTAYVSSLETQGLGAVHAFWQDPTHVLLDTYWTVPSTHTGTQDLYLQARVDANTLTLRAPFSWFATVHRIGL